MRANLFRIIQKIKRLKTMPSFSAWIQTPQSTANFSTLQSKAWWSLCLSLGKLSATPTIWYFTTIVRLEKRHISIHVMRLTDNYSKKSAKSCWRSMAKRQETSLSTQPRTATMLMQTWTNLASQAMMLVDLRSQSWSMWGTRLLPQVTLWKEAKDPKVLHRSLSIQDRRFRATTTSSSTLISQQLAV